MSLDTFMSVYERHLRAAHTSCPEQYKWPLSELPQVLQRMRIAIQKGSMNKDSHAFKATCKELGIKHTYIAIALYIKEM
jgi:hypothetical protein